MLLYLSFPIVYLNKPCVHFHNLSEVNFIPHCKHPRVSVPALRLAPPSTLPALALINQVLPRFVNPSQFQQYRVWSWKPGIRVLESFSSSLSLVQKMVEPKEGDRARNKHALVVAHTTGHRRN